MQISAVITCVSGEEKYLPLALSSIKNFASEIVIVDMSGGDEIKEIGKKFKAKVISHEFVNYVEPVRNFGISKASGDWILILDPDEELSGSLLERLKRIIEDNSSNVDYVRIPRKNIVFGKALKHSRWWPDYNIRFFKKGFVTWDETIHSVPMTQGNGIDLEAKEELAITHHHYESIEQFIERMNRYTTVQAKLKAETHEFKWQDLIIKPSQEFLSRFFAGVGYRDGVHGLALALLQAFSELAVYLKVWGLQKFEEQDLEIKKVIGELEGQKREFAYWENDLMVKINGGIIPRIRRKLKI